MKAPEQEWRGKTGAKEGPALLGVLGVLGWADACMRELRW